MASAVADVAFAVAVVPSAAADEAFAAADGTSARLVIAFATADIAFAAADVTTYMSDVIPAGLFSAGKIFFISAFNSPVPV